MIIGAHVSIAGGLDLAIDRGTALGAQAIQTFASPPRSMQVKMVEEEVITRYLEKKRTSEISYHIFHGVYLLNLATQDPEYLEVCVQSLQFYQLLAGKIGGAGTVFHLGSLKDRTLDEALPQITKALLSVLDVTPQGVKLILENAAGHKGTIGKTLDELASIYDEVHKTDQQLAQKLGFCLDTQHAFASGYDLSRPEGVAELLEAFNRKLGIEHLECMHLNDSMTPLGSKKDRHQNIGEGAIGQEGFRLILRDPRLQELPCILEVPGNNKSGPRREDVELLRKLAYEHRALVK